MAVEWASKHVGDGRIAFTVPLIVFAERDFASTMVAMTRTSAGARLRARLDAVLAERGVGWEWTAYDLEVIESAMRHADRAAHLQKLYDLELQGQPRPTTLSRLAAELRHQERRVVELVAMVSAPDEVPKSRRHQAAVNARWDRKRRREAAVVPMRGAQ